MDYQQKWPVIQNFGCSLLLAWKIIWTNDPMAGEMRYCSAHLSSPWYHKQVLFSISVYCTLKRKHVSVIIIIDNDNSLLSTHLLREHAMPGTQWIMLSESKYKQLISQHVCPYAYRPSNFVRFIGSDDMTIVSMVCYSFKYNVFMRSPLNTLDIT